MAERVEGVDPGSGYQSSESEKLAQKSADAFKAAEFSPDPATKAQKLEQAQAYAGDSALAVAYTYLQRIVGLIAVLLPLVLVVGNRVLGGDELEGSISDYYHTPVEVVFVGALCALAVFFLSYNYKPLRGFEIDNVLSTLASIAAVGVAFFPTTDNPATASHGAKVVAFVHLVFAGSLFILLAVFSLYLFAKTDSRESMTPAKKRRNRVYRTCGWIIVGAIVLVPVSNYFEPPSWLHSLFWLETIAVVAFGVSWLIKSGIFGILADEALPSDGSSPR